MTIPYQFIALISVFAIKVYQIGSVMRLGRVAI